MTAWKLGLARFKKELEKGIFAVEPLVRFRVYLQVLMVHKYWVKNQGQVF